MIEICITTNSLIVSEKGAGRTRGHDDDTYASLASLYYSWHTVSALEPCSGHWYELPKQCRAYGIASISIRTVMNCTKHRWFCQFQFVYWRIWHIQFRSIISACMQQAEYHILRRSDRNKHFHVRNIERRTKHVPRARIQYTPSKICKHTILCSEKRKPFALQYQKLGIIYIFYDATDSIISIATFI